MMSERNTDTDPFWWLDVATESVIPTDARVWVPCARCKRSRVKGMACGCTSPVQAAHSRVTLGAILGSCAVVSCAITISVLV